MSRWPTKTLGEICQLISGQHIDAKDYNTNGKGIGYLTGPSDFGSIYPVVSKWTEHPKVMARQGDVLITVKGSGVGKVNLLDEKEVAISRQLMALRVTGAEPRFVYAFLHSMLDHFQRLSTGAAIPGISREQVLSLNIALPPLSEQRRIVEILDEAFAGIAIAKANAERNLQNARALFESHLNSIYSEHYRDLPLTTLSNLASDITDGDHLPPPKALEGVPFITIRNIDKQTHKIDFSNVFRVPQTYFDALKPNRRPKENDVLYTVTGSYGIPVIVGSDEQFCFQRHIGLIRPKPPVNSKWLYFLLQTMMVRKQADDSATGAAQKTVSLTSLRQFVVPSVSLSRQLEDVARLEALLAQISTLESLLSRKRESLNSLKESLLSQAFSGGL